MPSFDTVSEINWVEVQNAVDQSIKEVANRFDFRGSSAKLELSQKEKTISLFADNEFQLAQVYEILIAKLAKRNVDVRSFKPKDKETIAGNKVRQIITIVEGLEQELAKKIVKIIKDSGQKLQASIQGNTVRISGAKKDSLQEAMTLLREKVSEVPLQFNNFRD